MTETLGAILKQARSRAGLTLRGVEKATDGKISNGYLSLLESDAVKEPSPRYLHELARVYKMDYARLMKASGYMVPAPSSSRALAFSKEEELTEEERDEVERF